MLKKLNKIFLYTTLCFYNITAGAQPWTSEVRGEPNITSKICQFLCNLNNTKAHSVMFVVIVLNHLNMLSLNYIWAITIILLECINTVIMTSSSNVVIENAKGVNRRDLAKISNAFCIYRIFSEILLFVLTFCSIKINLYIKVFLFIAPILFYNIMTQKTNWMRFVLYSMIGCILITIFLYLMYCTVWMIVIPVSYLFYYIYSLGLLVISIFWASLSVIGVILTTILGILLIVGICYLCLIAYPTVSDIKTYTIPDLNTMFFQHIKQTQQIQKNK